MARRRARVPGSPPRSLSHRLCGVALTLTTAGESHGPALVGIVTGLPAGLGLDRAAIEADLHRRQQGYGRSPRQQIETDTVEVLAGLRHGRTLGTPLAFLVRNRDHANWEWGMSPWPPEGDAAGKGKEPVTLPRPGHADLAGVMKYELSDARNALERASARHTAAIVAGGAVAKALVGEIGIEVSGASVGDDLEAASTRRGPTATPSAGSSRCGQRVSRPALAPTRRRKTAWTPGSPGRSWVPRPSRASRSATASPWRACGAPRPTTRSCATKAATGVRRITPAGWRRACPTARRSSCARR